MSIVDDILNRMVTIPSGEINLKDDRTKESWSVCLEPFLLSKYLVTQSIYSTVIGDFPSGFKGDELPVESVTWLEAVKFCNKLSELGHFEACYVIGNNNDKIDFLPFSNGFRLPTEAEWEYACKAGDNAVRYGDLDQIAWYKNNSNASTNKVGQKTPNKWGVYDMLGNVWEWCSDVYDETVYGSYRIFKGGGWCDEERGVLTTNRRRSHPLKFKIDDLGFRLAKNCDV